MLVTLTVPNAQSVTATRRPSARSAVLHGHVSARATTVVDADLAYRDTPHGVKGQQAATSAFYG
jgi:hypothetical protein